ncbi:unnamed protein product, partial [marine sediment metagenome]
PYSFSWGETGNVFFGPSKKGGVRGTTAMLACPVDRRGRGCRVKSPRFSAKWGQIAKSCLDSVSGMRVDYAVQT